MLKSDLSKVKVGDWVLNLRFGWEKIIVISKRENAIFPVETLHGTFTYDGFYEKRDKHPSVFVDPPPELIALYGPKPRIICPFMNGDRVVCDRKYRRYFSHVDDSGYWCYSNGQDAWSSKGALETWQSGLFKSGYWCYYSNGQDPWSSKGDLEAWPLDLVKKWEEDDNEI